MITIVLISEFFDVCSATCTCATNLLFIVFQDKKIIPLSSSQSVGAPIIFDTGNVRTYLDNSLYDPLLTMVHIFNILNLLLTTLVYMGIVLQFF